MADFFTELRRRKVIRVAIAYLIGAWIVIQVADVILPAVGLPDAAITWTLGILVAGFPLALVLSWVFDVTPDGIERTEDATASIAVIPFPDMSAEQDQEHFCDGLTEELINVLTCIPDLRVASRTSTFSLKGKQVDIKEVGEKLGVAHILEGSVRKSGNRIRVTAQLIEVKSDAHIWSENYDRELDDIFAIQDGIAACILDNLKLRLGPTRSASDDTSDAKAYEYYLRGRGYLVSKSNRGVEMAAEMFRKAVALDPDFTRAWLCLAEVSAISAVFYGKEDKWQQTAREARAQVERLAPEQAECFLASAYAFTACKEFADAEAKFLEVLQKSPEMAIAHHYLARAQLQQGKHAAAAASFSKAAEFDPDDFDSAILGTNAFMAIGDRDSALRLAKLGSDRAARIIEDFPDNQRAYYLGAGGLELLGEIDKAREWIEHSLALNPDDIATRYNAACFYAKNGDIDRAFELLDGSIRSREWIENDSDLDSLRGDPRYVALLESIPYG